MIFCDMTNVFVPSNDLAVSQLFFIFVRTKTFHHQTIMLSFVCDYSEGDRPSAPWLSEPPSSVVSAAAQAAKIDKWVNG